MKLVYELTDAYTITTQSNTENGFTTVVFTPLDVGATPYTPYLTQRCSTEKQARENHDNMIKCLRDIKRKQDI